MRGERGDLQSRSKLSILRSQRRWLKTKIAQYPVSTQHSALSTQHSAHEDDEFGAQCPSGGGERGQVTSRSGVLKPARSRVIIGENARREGGLAEPLQALNP